MKSFKEMLGETVDKIKSPDEQNFVDKHVIDKKEHPVAKDDQFIAKRKKSKRLADRDDGDDEAVYEERKIECPDCGESYAKGDDHECDMKSEDVKEEMTDAQMKKREEIVMSMKKKMGEFKAKYGDKAKDVMYATATKMAMKEETESLSEDIISDLRNIVKSKSIKRIKLDDGNQPRVDLTTASALTQVYDKLNDANKKKFADALAKNETMFMKMIDFAFSGGKK